MRLTATRKYSTSRFFKSSSSSVTGPGTHMGRLLYSLSPVWGAVFTTQQPLVARADLVDAEGQAAVGNVAARAANQAPLAHPLAVVSSAAHGRQAVPVHFTSGTWTQDRSFWKARSLPGPVGLCVFTFLSAGNAAVALPEHAAEAAHALGVPPTVVALPSLRNAHAKVSIARETPSTGPCLVTRSLHRGKKIGNLLVKCAESAIFRPLRFSQEASQL